MQSHAFFNFMYRHLGEKSIFKHFQISWQFDLNSLKKPIEKIEIRMAGIKTFESGQAHAVAYLGDVSLPTFQLKCIIL